MPKLFATGFEFFLLFFFYLCVSKTCKSKVQHRAPAPNGGTGHGPLMKALDTYKGQSSPDCLVVQEFQVVSL